MKPARLALIGDYSEKVLAHRAIPRALELARAAAGGEFSWQWVHTREIRMAARDLGGFSAVWVVPASPYENMAGALEAIRWARETGRPFLGTCGGFQHALIEFARNVAGLPEADHAETHPGGATLVVAPLACSLVDQSETIEFSPGSRLREIYGRDRAEEGYHCRYGLNPAHRARLEAAGLVFTARDASGQVRGAELPSHPFFLGTLFQPERAALRGQLPPLVAAWASAAVKGRG